MGSLFRGYGLHDLQPYLVYFYKPRCGHENKTVTNGTIIILDGRGHLTPSLKLENILHLRKLTTNLISIYKLINDLNSKVTFFNQFCVF